jgi:hypothetical protein
MKDDSEDELSAREIEILDRLIRESLRDETQTEQPDDSVLLKYVQGTASPAEVDRVQDALARSGKLRQEVAYLASLYEPDAQARFDAVSVPPRDRDVPWRRARRPLKPGWIVGGISMAAAAAILVSVWMSGSNRVVQWTEGAQLDTGVFQHEVYRGLDAPDFPEPSDHAEAATIAFMRVAEWKDGSFQLNLPSATPETGRNAIVTIGGVDERYTIPLPEEAENLELWYLAIPSLRTFRAPLRGDELEASKPPENTRGLLTVTYRTGDRFAATPPREAKPN